MLDRRWLRPRPTRRQVRTDVVIGLVAALVSVVNVELYHSGFGAGLGWHGVEAYAWFGAAGLVLAGRRALPLSTLLVEAVVFIVIGERLGMLGATFPIQMVLFAALYAAWAWSRQTRALLAVTTVVVAAMFIWLFIVLLRPGTLPQSDQGGLLDAAGSALVYTLLVNIVYFFGAIAWGQVAWRGARERAAAQKQTALELDLAEQQRRRAVRDERVRIARDLHDVVAHHVSSIGVQAAGAERMLPVDPDATRDALSTIGSSSRQAVHQMHQLVHLLRDPEPQEGRESERAPQPGIADIALLANDVGTPVIEHHVVGPSFQVPETTAASLFRIAQEAVTNVRRHAAARRASVVVRYLAEPLAVEVEVVDDGRGAHPAAGTRGGGYGLTGIRERAEIHGGETDIGPRPGGGFRVRVRVPVGEP